MDSGGRTRRLHHLLFMGAHKFRHAAIVFGFAGLFRPISYALCTSFLTDKTNGDSIANNVIDLSKAAKALKSKVSETVSTVAAEVTSFARLAA